MGKWQISVTQNPQNSIETFCIGAGSFGSFLRDLCAPNDLSGVHVNFCSQDELSHRREFGAQGHGLKFPVSGDAQESEVGGLVGAEELGVTAFPAGEHHPEGRGTRDHVVVGHHQPRRRILGRAKLRERALLDGEVAKAVSNFYFFFIL